MRRPLSSSMDCPEAPSSGLCSQLRKPKRPNQGFDVSPKLSANSARDGPSTCWQEVSAISNRFQCGLAWSQFGVLLAATCLWAPTNTPRRGHLLMLVQRIFISDTIHHQESDYCIQGKANTLYSCTHTNRSTGTPSSNATQPGLCIFAASALARAKFKWPGKPCTCSRKTDSNPPTLPSVPTRPSTILPAQSMAYLSCAA